MGPRCQISQTQTFVDIHILVVDDDATSLAVVSAMLKMCRYQVVTVKSPVEALNTLRERKGKIDIVITDLHMPQMNGLQLQKHVKQEFNLPVVVMSADEKPSAILKSLEEGVAFYMVKPISLHDLKHLWQYAITYKKVTLNQTTTVVRRGISIEKSTFKDSSSSASCSNEGKCAKSKNKKASTKGKENKVHKNSITIRKPKVVWTDSLHNRFLQAIRQIGLDKAVPKRILEFMNVPGLTRENVASHLQKYRIFLKRVAEKGASSLKNLPEYGIQRSNFASPHFPPPIYKHKFQSQFQFQFPYFSENHKIDCSLLNSQTILKRNFPIDLGLPNPNLEGTLIAPNLINNNQLANNIPFDSFKFMETEKNGFSGCFTTVEDDRNRLGNVQVSSGVQNDGFGWKGGFEEVGKESLGFIMDQGLNDDQFFKMISDTNLHENASVLLPLEEGEKVDSWKETNEIDAFENMVEENVCFNGDFLGEIFMEQNPNNQPSLREQGDGVEMLDADFSEIWNQIELDASTTEILSRPRFNSMEWDEGILEIMFGDNLPHREKVC